MILKENIFRAANNLPSRVKETNDWDILTPDEIKKYSNKLAEIQLSPFLPLIEWGEPGNAVNFILGFIIKSVALGPLWIEFEGELLWRPEQEDPMDIIKIYPQNTETGVFFKLDFLSNWTVENLELEHNQPVRIGGITVECYSDEIILGQRDSGGIGYSLMN